MAVSKKFSKEESEFGLVDAVMQKNRLLIVKKLFDAKPKHVSQLAKETGLSRVTTYYHLDILREAGIVEQEYVILKEPQSRKGKVGSFYKLNKARLTEALKIVEKMIEMAK